MAYISLNQIIDALEHLNELQLQQLQKWIEESNQPKNIESQSDMSKLTTLNEIRNPVFVMDFVAHCAKRMDRSRRMEPLAVDNAIFVKPVNAPSMI